MPDLRCLEQEIQSASYGYLTSPENSRQLNEITLGSVIGPFVVGKTTLIRAACSLDTDFCRVRSFTTREPRSDEEKDTYHFLPHDASTLNTIREQILAREVVQFTVHPTTSRVYGSLIETYYRPYALLDTMPSSLSNLDSVPFKAKKRVALVVSSEEWLARYSLRSKVTGRDDSVKRVQEGTSSLEWALDQGNDLFWIDNSGREIESGAQELVEIMKETKEQQQAARSVGEKLLNTLRAIEF